MTPSWVDLELDLGGIVRRPDLFVEVGAGWTEVAAALGEVRIHAEDLFGTSQRAGTWLSPEGRDLVWFGTHATRRLRLDLRTGEQVFDPMPRIDDDPGSQYATGSPRPGGRLVVVTERAAACLDHRGRTVWEHDHHRFGSGLGTGPEDVVVVEDLSVDGPGPIAFSLEDGRQVEVPSREA